MKDSAIIPFLLRLGRATFFTLDRGFYEARLRHAKYRLVFMDIEQTDVAAFVRRFLRHPQFNTRAKRMGGVIRLSSAALSVWRLHAEKEAHFAWPTNGFST